MLNNRILDRILCLSANLMSNSLISPAFFSFLKKPIEKKQKQEEENDSARYH
jgi:hypothetical protein